MKKLIQQLLPIADFFLLPFVYPAAWLLKRLRKAGVHKVKGSPIKGRVKRKNTPPLKKLTFFFNCHLSGNSPVSF